jgi:hypothetical protein
MDSKEDTDGTAPTDSHPLSKKQQHRICLVNNKTIGYKLNLLFVEHDLSTETRTPPEVARKQEVKKTAASGLSFNPASWTIFQKHKSGTANETDLLAHSMPIDPVSASKMRLGAISTYRHKPARI